ncbi:MAG: non-hydrolyzing UDP-N-acetylglucosamine 2-epimerase [Candidatus Odinarchaeota archaeon]
MPDSQMKLCFVLGTRPEIIKLYSVMKATENHRFVNPVFVHTGQHYDYEMSQVFLEELNLPKFHHFLDVKSAPHGKQTALLLTETEKCLVKEKPDVVIVQGDTNTALAGALAAVKLQIPVAHVEAGCRSFDQSMPEEINRLVVDAVSSIFFAPSEITALNLLFEGKSTDRVFLAGNTVSDIVEETRVLRNSIKLDNKEFGEFDVVMTLHRQENVDNKTRLADILKALTGIQGTILFPIHPRTSRRIKDFGLEGIVNKISNLRLIKPQNYLTFMKLLEGAKIVITDSGGVQEEAMMVGTPCITARNTTEWPETVWAGANYLAGNNIQNMVNLCNKILNDEKPSSQVGRDIHIGNSGRKIIETLVKLWKENLLELPIPDMTGGGYPVPWLLDLEDSSGNQISTTLTFNEDGKATINENEKKKKKIVRSIKS